MSDIKNGQILIAEPFMEDAFFRQAVILICEHTDESSHGFILNKRLDDLNVTDLLDDLPEWFEAPVYFGGPVEQRRLNYLHNVGNLLEDSLEVLPGVWWGGDFNQLQFLINSKLITPEHIRFYVGYTGWEAGQLSDELEMHSWILGEGDPNYVFDSKGKNLWATALRHKGGHYAAMAEVPRNIHYN